MQGFGVHTFKFVNIAGDYKFVKFHWIPKNGVHSLLFEEAVKIAGQDADFNRRDLYESIESGNFPEFELGVQIFDESTFQDIDLLDATKIVPEELAPVKRIGRLVLNKNPTNFFAETEQVAFCPNNLVPGIDFSNDPLLLTRTFSYLDTQRHRLGSANFNQLPINKPFNCPYIGNNQQDGFMNHEVPTSKVNYWPNSLGMNLRGGACPMADLRHGLFTAPEPTLGKKTRDRNANFTKDPFSQATMFWNSMTPIEQMHIVEAAQVELSKVTRKEVRERVVNNIFAHIDATFATRVAERIGLPNVAGETKTYTGKVSPALSIIRNARGTARGRRVAVIVNEGFDHSVIPLKKCLEEQGLCVQVISGTVGALKGKGEFSLDVDRTFIGTDSVLFDGIIVTDITSKIWGGKIFHWISEAYRHCKTIGFYPEAAEGAEDVLKMDLDRPEKGLIVLKNENSPESVEAFSKLFASKLAMHRHWERQLEDSYGSILG